MREAAAESSGLRVVHPRQTLGDLVELQRGYDLTTDERQPGSIPVIGGGGANGYHAVANVHGPGVALARSGSGFGNAWWIESDFWAHNTVMFVKDYKGNDPRYVYYVLDWIDFSKHNSGGAQPSLNRNFIYPIPVHIPPLSEQRKIAEILRTWDEALEKLTALRVVKERWYRAFARKFFEPCHPSFHGRQNNWQEFEFGDIFTERSQAGEVGERLLSVTMNGGVIDRDDVGRKDTSTEDKSQYKLVLPGDIAYNTMRMWQGVSGLSTMRGIVSPAYTVVKPREGRIVGRYAAHLFKSHRMVFDFERYSQGLTSDTWNLKFPAFSKIKVLLPPVEDQGNQANLLDAMLFEQDLLRRQIEALTRQKRGLMQKLLTGEWRVHSEKELA